LRFGQCVGAVHFANLGEGSVTQKYLAYSYLGLIGVCLGATSAARGQQAPTPADTGPERPAASPDTLPVLEEIVVTGYRKSLSESTAAKRDAIGFLDQVSAEDIGKFPDTNIAEAFNRIPGITITRDIDGEGTDISIRGLGTNFTKILLNGAPVAVASTGTTDSQNTNREVDLDLFPTELFTQLTVKKTSSADMIEGGAAGTVDMRSARPFDSPGPHFTYTAQGTKNQSAPQWGERGAIIASDTWDNGFGALVGVAGVANRVNVKGFESIGWTNANLSTAQCGAGNTCNQPGGNNWTIPAIVPAGVGNGLTAGTAIDNAFLLSHNPGLTTQQLDNALIPRLGRSADEYGSRDRGNAIVSLEYRPTDDLHLYVDSMYGHKKNNEQRIDMDWVGRSGAAIPLNMTVDRSDCSSGCVATAGTFANSQFFLEYRPYTETVNFYGVNPGLTWQIADAFKMDVQANKTSSTFHRESPSVLVSTPMGAGLTVDYANTGAIPSIQSNVDLNNPANFGWYGGSRVNVQDEKRDTGTKGARTNFTWGVAKDVDLQFGASYDDIQRKIRGYDNTQAWQNATCGDNPNIFVPAPNLQPACAGVVQVGAPAGYPNYPVYPGYGTGYTAGKSGPVVYQGSLVPNGSVPSYLTPGPAGFVTLNWPAFAGASNYSAFHNAETATTGANTGANAGFVEEKDAGFYVEAKGDTHLFGNRLRYTGGARYVHTDQTIGGYVSIPSNLNPANPIPNTENTADGGLYPNTLNYVYTNNTYHNILPSGELAYNVTESAVVRFAASRTMTRPNPSAMLPGLAFTSPSADIATVGNPALQPYLSTNFDLGVEYYTGQEGYVSAALFRKRITGFTNTGNVTVPFNSLAQYGVTFDTLTRSQQDAITARNGPDAATVTLQEQVNAPGVLSVNGVELNWVQPLDFVLDRVGLDGFGYTVNYTRVKQNGTGAAPAVATGVAPHTYNITVYYEHGPVSVRFSDAFNKGSISSTYGQNGITKAAIYSSDYSQWDFSSSLDMSKVFGWSHEVQLTADALNLFDAHLHTYFQFPNATFTDYSPGREILIGIRGKF
jgi:TonB-dependent receptor